MGRSQVGARHTWPHVTQPAAVGFKPLPWDILLLAGRVGAAWSGGGIVPLRQGFDQCSFSLLALSIRGEIGAHVCRENLFR